ncbi:MAG: sulfurtransferase [Solirubrobacterales bacterium]
MIEPFVDAGWVRERRGEVVLADCRWYMDGRSGREAYDGGHISDAVFVDLDAALVRRADPAEAGRHPLAEPEDFAAAMGALGIGDDDTVVAYDDAGGVIAARLVWMLRVTDHEAALLDGGIQAWEGELETAPASRPATSFTASEWPVARLASIDEVAVWSATAAPSGESTSPATQARSAAPILIDGRQRERYLGEADAVDPRAGHIPGALAVPCRENLDADGRLLTADRLRANFPFDDDAEVVSYCGSGVTACHNLLAMEQIGLRNGRLFPGSWSQWSRDPARPAEIDAVSTP